MKQNDAKAKEKQISELYEEFVTQKLKKDIIQNGIVSSPSSS